MTSLEFIYVSDAVMDRREVTVNVCNRFYDMFGGDEPNQRAPPPRQPVNPRRGQQQADQDEDRPYMEEEDVALRR